MSLVSVPGKGDGTASRYWLDCSMYMHAYSLQETGEAPAQLVPSDRAAEVGLSSHSCHGRGSVGASASYGLVDFLDASFPVTQDGLGVLNLASPNIEVQVANNSNG